MSARRNLRIAVLLTAAVPAWGAQSPQVPLPGKAIAQFAQPLPTLAVAPQYGTITTVAGNQPLTLRMCEFDAAVLPMGTVAPGQQPLTRVWGYLVDPTGASTCSALAGAYANPATGAVETYIGPVIVNERGSPTEITWVNDLGDAATTGVLAYRYSTDQTLHWADPLALGCMDTLMGMVPAFGDPCAENFAGPVPAVPHLHGGEVPPELDGGPDAWFTSDGSAQGAKYYSFPPAAANAATYRYPNTQEAAPIWFHDHTLGATRLNVYAGLAGAYLIHDPALQLPANLQPLTEVVPLVIQDRMFDRTGQLFFPSDSAGNVLWAVNPEHPYWVPEFVGDAIVVNGKAWPYVSVQPRRYRFLLLNGSNARTYELALVNPATGAVGPALWVIGTDGGYLDAPVKIDPALGQKLVLQPGERYEVVVDFAAFPGATLLLRNTGRTPYPKGTPPPGSTLGRIVQFRVGAAPVADASYNPAGGTPLRAPGQKLVRLADPTTGGLAVGVTARNTRQLTLNEVMGMPITATDPVTGLVTAYPGGPLEILVNNTKYSGTAHGAAPRPDFTAVTVGGVTTWFSELPREGDTEVWELVNLTADAHPIHLHLVQFQILSRQGFNRSNYTAVYNAAFPGGLFAPGYGPPKAYDFYALGPNVPLRGPLYGGNPDVAPYLQGPLRPSLPSEAGWKDTVVAYPGEVTRIAVRWAPTDLPSAAPADRLYFPFDPNGDGGTYNYVWHCHIVDHEDNEMMRPDLVGLNPLAPVPAARPLVKNQSY